ncbi:MAG: DUF447 domain-containing protein [Gammaproteobacteria bacterium]
MIYEAVIITRNADRSLHIVPMGYRESGEDVVLAPFRPSTTLDNLARSRQAVINLTDNVAIIAGCLTGRFEWPTLPAAVVDAARLTDTLAHLEVEVRHEEPDEERPRFVCAVRHREQHRPFRGFNRAQAAVVEAAILVSRLHLLPAEKPATGCGERREPHRSRTELAERGRLMTVVPGSREPHVVFRGIRPSGAGIGYWSNGLMRCEARFVTFGCDTPYTWKRS